jgi:hypothetical protein
MKILWGHKIGTESWCEDVLCTQEKRFEEVKALAAKDGYTNFRVSIDKLISSKSKE